MEEKTDNSRDWVKDELGRGSKGGPVKSSKPEMKEMKNVDMQANEKVGK